MLFAILLALSCGDGAAKLEQLAVARMTFDHTQMQGQPMRGDSIYHMLGGDGSFAFYPVGVADRRYMVVTDGDGHPCRLMFEQMHGTIAKREWVLDLQPSTGTAPFGTLNLMLREWRAQVDAVKLTPQQNASLTAVTGFTFYEFSSAVGTLVVSYIHPDGKRYKLDEYDLSRSKNGVFQTYLPLCGEDSEALGYGNRRWYRPGESGYVEP